MTNMGLLVLLLQHPNSSSSCCSFINAKIGNNTECKCAFSAATVRVTRFQSQRPLICFCSSQTTIIIVESISVQHNWVAFGNVWYHFSKLNRVFLWDLKTAENLIDDSSDPSWHSSFYFDSEADKLAWRRKENKRGASFTVMQFKKLAFSYFRSRGCDKVMAPSIYWL